MNDLKLVILFSLILALFFLIVMFLFRFGLSSRRAMYCANCVIIAIMVVIFWIQS